VLKAIGLKVGQSEPLGEKDRAFEYLGRALTDRTVLMAGLSFWPEFDSLHSDPRFVALVKRVGPPE